MLDSALGEPSDKHVDSSNSLPTNTHCSVPRASNTDPAGLCPILLSFKLPSQVYKRGALVCVYNFKLP